MNLGVSFKFVSEVAKLDKAITAMHKKALSRSGGFIRKQTIKSLGKGMESSREGTPPTSYGKGKYSLKFIRFEVDEARLSTPIGYTDPKLQSIAKLHENGGVVSFKKIPAYRIGSRALIPYYTKERTKNGEPYIHVHPNQFAKRYEVATPDERRAAKLFFKLSLRNKTLTYKPRPFMSPSLMKNREKALMYWRNAL